MEHTRKKEIITAYRERKQVGCVFEIRCTENGKCFVRSDSDTKGAENRFAFAQSTNMCPLPGLQADWQRYGAKAFTFRFVETLEKGKEQTEKEFREDLSALAEMVREKYTEEELY